MYNCDDERIFVVYEAFKRGVELDEIYKITGIDRWFLSKINNLVYMEMFLEEGELTKEKYKDAKDLGFLDSTIKKLSGQEPPEKITTAFKMVDTCAAEFAAETPYFYATYDSENEAADHIKRVISAEKK